MVLPYRILDLTGAEAQFCGRLLADFGCRVIKIEPPGGDPARLSGPFLHDKPGPEMSLSWWANNAGKESVVADLGSGQGQEYIRQLAEGADAIIESYHPGHLDNLGLGYASLREANPGLVMASITPFGQTGPYRDYRGPDIVVAALSGFMYMHGEPDRAPLNSTVPQVFLLAATHAAQAILLALHHRERTGRGQYIDVSALQSIAWIAAGTGDIHYWKEYGRIVCGREGNTNTAANGIVRHYLHPCRDGFVCFFLFGGGPGARSNRGIQEWMEAEGVFEPALQGMEWEEWDFYTTTQQRVDEIEQAFRRFFLRHTRRELQEGAVARSIVLAAASSIGDLLASPQLASRQFWKQVEVPVAELEQVVTFPGPSFQTSAPSRAPAPAPLIGGNGLQAEDRAGGPGSRRRLPQSSDSEGGPTPGGALSGLKVLDFTQALAGPIAGRLMAEQGAMVIHVESVTRVDLERVIPPFKGGKPGVNLGLVFADFEAGKYGVTLNMENPRGREVARRLVQWADVLVDSRTPGVLEKWGLDYDSLVEINPDIILARLTNQGALGPWAKHPGYGTAVIGQAGMIGILGWPDGEPLMMGRGAYADLIAGNLFAASVLAAVLHRLNTGRGQSIDASMVEAGISFLAPQVLDRVVNGREISRMGNRRPNAAPHGAYRCQGGDGWCAIAVSSDEEWGLLCRAIGQPALCGDPRFATITDRKANEDALDAIVDAWTITQPPEQAMRTLQEAGVPAGAVRDFRGVCEDPQMVFRHHLRPMPHPEMGSYHVTSFPYVLSETPCVTPEPAPCMGQHNEYVYCHVLGYSDEEFMEMDAAGVFQ